MSQRPQPDTSELDLECPCHGPDQICSYCRPDICNPSHPVGTGFCGSASNPNSANLTPVAAPKNIYGYYTHGDTGKNFMSGAFRSPSAASVASSGQGPSNPRPIQQQPGPTAGMQYPSSGSTGYGTMGAYATMAQSPSSYYSGEQDFYGSMDAGAGDSSQWSQPQGDPVASKGQGKGKGKGKGTGKEKRH